MRAVISGVTAGVVLAAAISAPRAQAPQQPDLAHAKELYDAANQAMNENRFDDAAQGYGAAYDITHDPILFFKIGVANEKAGRCDTALIYFGRYLKEANPELKFQEMAQEHIRACHGDARDIDTTAEPAGSGSGSAEPAAGSGSAAEPPSSGSDAGSALVAPPPPPPEHPHGNDAAWLMVGGGLAFVTLGAVLAYAASSSEQDLKDLYVGLDGNPPVYDTALAKRYQSLLDEGHRYEHLSWGAFGVAGGFAVAATILFVRGHHESRIEPVVGAHSAGVSVHF
jgi:tetratricopeptide (TPR) repeat protein